jgi:acetate---CoA ligase (ADP-forming)
VRVPGYEFPEDAARAVALAASYGRWRARPQRAPKRLVGARPEQAAAVISQALAERLEWLAPAPVAGLLESYGLPLIPTRIVSGAEEAVAAARHIGGPVALKAVSSGLIHKSDIGGVRLDCEGADEVRAAAAAIEDAVACSGHVLDGLIVQPMAPPGVELIVGVVNDPSFGPVLACGAGGTAAELLKDFAVRITPVSELDADEMLRSLRTFPLLDGYRGATRCDLDTIKDLVARVSALVDDHPGIAELDLNPVVASSDGVLILDARVRVEVAPPEPPMPSLRAS